MISRRHERRGNAHQIWDISSVRQLDSWQKYNHESLLSNLKSPKAWLRLSTPIEYKCSAYFVATKRQTILIASKKNHSFFQQATVIVILKVQKRRKVKLRGSDCDVNDQKEKKTVLLNELFLFSYMHYLKRDCTTLLQRHCFHH